MRAILLSFVISVYVFSFNWAQTTITNKGVEITNTKSTIYINGNYSNEANASIANGGTIYISGDITNNSDTCLFTTRAGKVLLNGVSPQNISGNVSIQFYNLEIDKFSNEVQLQQTIQVHKQLLLSNGNLFMNGHTIELDTAGFLEGENENKRVYGDGLLRAKRFIDSSRARLVINQAGLGLYISTKEQFGYVMIERGHQQQSYNGDTSIFRYYNFQPLTVGNKGLIDTIKLAYLSSETVGEEKDYKVYALPDFGAQWKNKGGQVDEVNHFVLSTTVSPPEIGRARFSVFSTENNATCLPNDPSYISAVFLVSTNVYAGDSTHFVQLTSPEPTSSSWNFGDGVIGNEFSPFHIYQLESEDSIQYKISMTVSNGVCSDTRNKYITVHPKPALKSQEDMFIGFTNVNLYPNPGSGTFNVEYKLAGNAEVFISVMDLQGKMIERRSLQINDTKEYFDLSSYGAGMYYVKLQAGEDTRVLKMVKF